MKKLVKILKILMKTRSFHHVNILRNFKRVWICEYSLFIFLDEKFYFEKYSRALCDVEDLFKEGKEHRFCPYFLQKRILVLICQTK